MDSSHPNGDALAAPFIGFIIGTMLFGITILQTYQYFLRYPKDSAYCKSKVTAIFVLDLLHFVFSATLMYTFLISNFGVTGAYTKNVWSLKAMATTQAALIILVQTVYLERIYMLSNVPVLSGTVSTKLITGLISVIIPSAIAIGTICCYKLHKAESILSLNADLTWAVYLAFSSEAIIDTTIASLMCYMLHKHRLDVGIHISRRFDQSVSNLIKYMLATGLLTSCASIMVIVLFIAQPDSITYIAITFSVTRLYTNSVLAMLNVRKKNNVNNELEDSPDLAAPLSAIVFGWTDPLATVRSRDSQGEHGGIEALRLDSQLDLLRREHDYPRDIGTTGGLTKTMHRTE